MIPECIRFDSMHVLCLGVDLLVAGNVMKTLLQYDFWGDGDESQKLLVGWQRFKQWARTNGWQPLASQIWWFMLFLYVCSCGPKLSKKNCRVEIKVLDGDCAAPRSTKSWVELRHSMPKFCPKRLKSNQHPYPELQCKAWNVSCHNSCLICFFWLRHVVWASWWVQFFPLNNPAI